MNIIVQKFGGSSVANKDKIKNICKKIVSAYNANKKVVVVVSAQGKTTDTLVKEAKEISNDPSKREYDVLLSVGEQISISKVCMCLQSMGYKAVSYTGWQLPIITDSNYGNSRIKEICSEKILNSLEEGYIVVVAGFQGVDELGNITTLGRGGSDTTAVALAAKLKAEVCEIYTDVDGIYSSDPRIVEDVKKIDIISYDEMLELASLGAKVLHNRCVEIADKYDVHLLVKSSFLEDSKGTLVRGQMDMEALNIKGIAKDDNVARVILVGADNKIGRMYEVFKLLAEQNINVDIIVKSLGEHAIKDIAFTVSKDDLKKAVDILDYKKEELDIKEIKTCDNLSKVSIVGAGMVNNSGVAAKVFEALYENNINMHMISTSEIKISVLVDTNKADLAMNAIHKKFF